MEIVPTITILNDVFRVCPLHNHPAYDTAFLVLAESRGIPFVTADKQFYRKARLYSRSPVLLSDLRS